MITNGPQRVCEKALFYSKAWTLHCWCDLQPMKPTHVVVMIHQYITIRPETVECMLGNCMPDMRARTLADHL